jgi:hypothetical protein
MIHLWIRATTCWADEATFRAQLDPRFAPKVETWNATFSIPYHLFRHELRAIAGANLARVEGARVSEWDAIPEGAWVVPVDDDDWLAPDVALVLAEHDDPAILGFRWVSSFLEQPIDLGHRLGLLRRKLFPRTRPRWICTTNNYALRKADASLDLLRRHTEASRWFAGAGRERVRSIDRRLSLMNRTLASQTSLGFRRPSVTRGELMRKYRAYRSLYRRVLPAELAWATPWVERMAALMARLEVRR